MLLYVVKMMGMLVFIIGYVMKFGDIVGLCVLEYIVDVVFYLEGDVDRVVCILCGYKNCYGFMDEVGVF